MSENKKLKRTIFFEDSKDSSKLIMNYEAAYCNWNLKDRIKFNTNELKSVLKVDDIQKVKVKIINDADESNSDLRIYVYKAKNCNTKALKIQEVSHALQVSIDSSGRNNWVLAENDFSGKVFIDNVTKLTMLIEDVILDIQMFYFYNYEKSYCDYLEKREFSKKKVNFLAEKGVHSYLGDVKDTEYISFSSFCRDEKGEINFLKYIKIWEEFNNLQVFEQNKNVDNKNLEEIFSLHPKYCQLSMIRIKKILSDLPAGEYILVRTEKKPKKGKQILQIKKRFGLKEWKTGKIKIVEMKHRFTYQKMKPYISIFEFSWKGVNND